MTDGRALIEPADPPPGPPRRRHRVRVRRLGSP